MDHRVHVNTANYIVYQKRLHVYVVVISTNVDQFQKYLAHSIPKKVATQRLLTCPPHLHTTAALPWEKSFRTFRLI